MRRLWPEFSRAFGPAHLRPLHSSFAGSPQWSPAGKRALEATTCGEAQSGGTGCDFRGIPPEPFLQQISQPEPMSTIQPVAGQDEQHPDVALVAQVRAGDVAAYDTLVRKYERQIFRIAQHITQNREDAEDVMQDAFLKAYEKLDQFQGNSKFYTWLVRIAVNESLMRLRKRRTGKLVSMDEDVQTDEGSVPRDFADWAPNPEQNYTQAELAEILRKTIQGLPQGFRVVFVLRDVEGLSTEETAETLGLSVPAVKSRLLRARLQLRERLTRYFGRKTPAVAPAAAAPNGDGAEA
jgi:RNA polymerase sigma-70 factor (ECF subfamily)